MAPIAFSLPIRPEPHTIWAIGAYTTIDHTTKIKVRAPNFMRPAKEPVTMAAVTMANAA